MVVSLTRLDSAPVQVCCRSFYILFLFLAAVTSALADVNSWTNSHSANWEDQTNWSLGVPPDATQSIMLTNAGFKAIAISGNTAQKFPLSMQVQGLQIASPADSFNELLMNFSGFTVPLQTDLLSIGTNSAVVVQSSMLQSTNIFVGGTFDHGDFSRVTVQGQLDIATGVFQGNGAYYLTNGTLSVGVGISIGGVAGFGKFVQYGGNNDAGTIQLNLQAEFDLYGGQVTATNDIIVGYGDYANLATFNQSGGSVNADMYINGLYFLTNGTVTGEMQLSSGGERVDASMTQTGGTNFATSLTMGQPNQFGGRGNYTLSGGVLRVASSVPIRGSQFSQNDGQATIASNLVMTGVDVGLGVLTANYLLEGGTLSVLGGVTEQGAVFRQDGGTNLIAGDLVLIGVPPPPPGNPQSVSYTLGGGFLSAQNVTVNARFFDGFRQTGGSCLINGQLTVQGPGIGSFYYTLQGGTLTVKDIYVGTNAFFQHTSGAISQSGVLTLNQGEWRAATNDQTLGPLQLAGGPNTNSAITFPSGSSILRLANSSAQPWASAVTLYISNWHGWASGGGQTQLHFGTDANGLTAQQLAAVKFPLAGGLYPAQILSNGEVVPQQFLTSSRSGHTLTVTWPPGWTLQSATNLTGPFQDVQPAASPYTASTTNPVAFFRLRQ
jgi:hypothetical protein